MIKTLLFAFGALAWALLSMLGMSQRYRTQFVDAQGGIIFDSLGNRWLSVGSAAPTNSVLGYNPASIFLNSGGAIGSFVYANTGTLASSTWTNIL